jgi:hypothetical protein
MIAIETEDKAFSAAPPDNPYLGEVLASLPRVLSLFDRDPLSPTLGFGDRLHWGWKLTDFANGTFQGAANGLARLCACGLLPASMSTESVIARIEEMIAAIAVMRRRDGSLEEAFPYESSFCVSALAAYDALAAIAVLDARLAPRRRDALLEAVAPAVHYVLKAKEGHGIITNHLSTGAAMLTRWHGLTGGGGAAARKSVEAILRLQDDEGWFPEYGGADPGYQSLCMVYLADIDLLQPDWGLGPGLKRAVHFLSHFAHPDGSFGGVYGSRNTRFYYPAGIEQLAERDAEALALATHMRRAIGQRRVVDLAAMDESNVMPMFNAYGWAAQIHAQRAADDGRPVPPLPCLESGAIRRHFPAAGVLVDGGPDHYTVVNWRKGGVYSHFAKTGAVRIDAGLVVADGKGRLFAAQGRTAQADVDGDCLLIRSDLRQLAHPMPTPVKFIILRLLAISVLRIQVLRDLAKKLLVRMLITRRGDKIGENRRRIILGPDLSVIDDPSCRTPVRVVTPARAFSSSHMASQGYWQIQDDAP